MPISGKHSIINPASVPENIWKQLKTYVYTWILAHVGEEHLYLIAH